jgi:pimeloyl-ACP methyl ester carboxylesterase
MSHPSWFGVCLPRQRGVKGHIDFFWHGRTASSPVHPGGYGGPLCLLTPDETKPSVPAAMPVTTFAGGRLFGASYGSGRPWVLALHGWRRTHQDFASILDGVDAVALDLPGFGVASPPPEAWSTEDYATWIAPVLDHLAPGCVVLGHSFGGRVAVQLAAAHPSAIGALVLTGVPLVRDPAQASRRSPVLYRAGRLAHRIGLVSERRMEALRQRYGSEDYRTATGSMRGVLVKAVNESYEGALASFPGPIELVWGANDDQVPVGVARAAMASCVNPRLTVVSGGDHFTPRSATDALRDALDRHRPT